MEFSRAGQALMSCAREQRGNRDLSLPGKDLPAKDLPAKDLPTCFSLKTDVLISYSYSYTDIEIVLR